jgi:AraC-like DNA-binding protein
VIDHEAADRVSGFGESIKEARAVVAARPAGSDSAARDYACLLGYSARTLSRADEDAAGVGAKQFIDRRIVLEAKRLLAHTDLPAATIAKSLGLSSATNFSKYFRQRTGQTPLEFRRAIRGTA